MTDSALFMQNLWASSLAVIPMAIGVSVLCRSWIRRPATRHALWLMVLLTLLAPSVASLVGMPSLPDPLDVAAKWARSIEPSEAEPVEPPASVALAPPRAPPDTEGVKSFVAVHPWSLPPMEAPIASNRANPFGMNRSTPSQASTSRQRGTPPMRYDQPVPLSHLLGNRRNSVTSPQPSSRSLMKRPPQSAATSWNRQRALPGRSRQHAQHEDSVEVETTQSLAARDPAAPRADPKTSMMSDAGESMRSWASNGFVALREWGSKARGVRDAMAALPPMPAVAWFGGVALILIVWLSRGASRRRLLISAVRTPESVQLLVDDTSRVMGLDQSPAAYFIDGRVSPMVLAMSFRPRLILPRALWNELEHDARRSVLVHELAHLRRRDHWVCQAQWVIGLIYWWHPVVWWIRRRIREEADLACDAWVMSLLPSCRRTYAETLVKTKDYLSVGATPVPALALEMTSPRAKRFARRLTMVMTHKTGPQASPFGLALAAAIALGGMMMAPAMGCHTQKKDATAVSARETIVVTAPGPKIASAPEASSERDEVVSGDSYSGIGKDSVTVGVDPKAPKYVIVPNEPGVTVPKIEVAPTYIVVPKAPGVVRIAPVAPVAPQVLGFGDPERDEDEGASTFERHMNQRESDEHEEAIEKLEQKLQRLEERVRERVERRTREAPRPSRAPWADEPPRADAPSGDTFALIYVIPEGKLRALAQLMIREDIPILVRPGDNGLTVWGTRGQHRIFRAFAELINPDGVKVLTPDGESVRSSAPRADGDQRLARRQHEQQVRRHEQELHQQQRRHEQQMQRHQRQQDQHSRQMDRHRRQLDRERQQLRRHRSHDDDDCSPRRSGEIRRRSPDDDDCSPRRGDAINRQRLEIEIETRHHDAQANREVAQAIEGQIDQFREMAELLAAEAEAKASQADGENVALDQVASALEEIGAQRDSILTEADALREQAEELASQADDDDLNDAEREAIEELAEQLEEQAELVDEQAELYEEQSEQVEEQAEAMAEAMAEAIEEQVEAIQEQAEAYEEAIEELMAEIEELVEEAAELEAEAAEIESQVLEDNEDVDDDDDEDVEVVATSAATNA